MNLKKQKKNSDEDTKYLQSYHFLLKKGYYAKCIVAFLIYRKLLLIMKTERCVMRKRILMLAVLIKY